jgi:hypothetical protein
VVGTPLATHLKYRFVRSRGGERAHHPVRVTRDPRKPTLLDEPAERSRQARCRTGVPRCPWTPCRPAGATPAGRRLSRRPVHGAVPGHPPSRRIRPGRAPTPPRGRAGPENGS